MSSQPALQKQESIDLDNFELEAPKAVNKFEPEDIKNKIGETKPDGTIQTFSKIEKNVLDNLDTQVDNIMKDLLSAPLHSQENKDLTTALNQMGDKEINQTSQVSGRMLERPLRAMSQNDAGDGKSVAASLKALRMKVTELDPSNRDALFTRNKFLGFKLPFGIGNKVDSYMQEFKSSESQINDIVKSLYSGKDELLKDNAFIDVERENMYSLMQRLEQYAYIMKKLDQKIEAKLPEIEASDRMKASDIKQEILFPIRQKTMDIVQHLAVCLQGYMSLQVVKRNNVELIRGVDRAANSTISALRIAVIVSEALGTQKLVLDQINAVNETTNKLLDNNAKLLETQGVAIQKQATEASVNPEVLAQSFQRIFKAMDAIDNYREQALPNMQKTIDSLQNSIDGAKNYLAKDRAQRIAEFSQELAKEESPEDKAVVKVKY